ncbi:MAG: CpaF family protein [Candidatus Wallbacteria bacterium]|nr:CpaF family protein [Candidatus Wallbacteria bacterium]
MDCFPLGLHHVTRRPTSAPHIGGLEGRELEKTIRIRGLIFDLMMDKLAALENQGKKLDIEDERAFVQREAMTLFHEVSRSQGIALSEKAGRAVVSELVNEIAGFGPITPLLYDPQVSEVMVNGPWQIYAEKKGKLTLTDSYFRDDSHAMRIINKIVSPLGRRCDVSSPIVDARLPDGSRVNAAIPPVALCGPTITIRKFSKKPIGMDKLVGFGTLTAEMSAFLHACVLLRLNMVISGGTGSGKTTTLNAISSFIPEDERIITVEDAAELQLQQDHVVGLESRPPNVEGAGAITIRDLVKNTLRMRPERIIVGECRAGETLDMLQAMNTGHDGSLTSGHANTPRDMIARLETMVMMAGMELPSKSIREQIASAVNLIVQQSRLHDGKRKITYISEVAGIDGDEVKLVDLFRFYQHGVDDDGHIFGESRATGNLPSFLLRFKYEKIPLPDGIFGIPKTMDQLFAEAEEKRGNDPLG